MFSLPQLVAMLSRKALGWDVSGATNPPPQPLNARYAAPTAAMVVVTLRIKESQWKVRRSGRRRLFAFLAKIGTGSERLRFALPFIFRDLRRRKWRGVLPRTGRPGFGAHQNDKFTPSAGP